MTGNILNALLCFVFLLISLRAFFLYAQLRSSHLLTLGLATSMISCTAAADTISGFITSIHLNTDWFLFIGQGVAFTFLFLSLLNVSDTSTRRITQWHIFASLLILLLLVFASLLPAFPNMAIKVVLSGYRSLICFLIFTYYASLFLSKSTRFTLLMSISFFFLSLGYFLILPSYVMPGQEMLNMVGDILRIASTVNLIFAYTQG